MDAGILVFEGADELDIVGPQRVLAAVNDVRAFVEAPEMRLHLVAARPGSVTLAHGLKIEAPVGFDTCPVLDVLVVPGGGSNLETAGRRIAQRDDGLLAFISSRAAKATITASVCTGAILLAAAGLLDGKRVNTHWRSRDELRALMVERGEEIEIVPERVVWDDNLVTGGGVTSGIDVALSIVERTYGAKVRRAIEAALELETPPA